MGKPHGVSTDWDWFRCGHRQRLEVGIVLSWLLRECRDLTIKCLHVYR